MIQLGLAESKYDIHMLSSTVRRQFLEYAGHIPKMTSDCERQHLLFKHILLSDSKGLGYEF